MTLKKWFYLFWTTLLIGGGITLVMGLSLQIIQGEFQNFTGPMDRVLNVVQLILSGFTVSVYSQMGFFAYLTLNFIAIGLFKKSWPYIQAVLTVIALLDLMFLRMLLADNASQRGGDAMNDMLLGLAVLAVALIVGYFKVKATNRTAFIPTLFFMIAITTVETLSALNISGIATWYVYLPLAACNAYQVLMLNRILGTPKS
ncbi:KinB-signaling pathway activation protein [Paenibacillus thiaminolyticus]|uniref:KinB-signaling pathway activation protein n=1 Tax=Paenibacillus thiaminolyticus TaxID=49283 RepID=A0AAP9DY31_PANTH|nr:KinB-signaling pathway activation protein [Paenibacillus thiaminolyticus]MCY9537488.1 KinB-signaling pathway activation protein [Paenibacillus thiaminolyticus]MCY9604815.1 KinB-signaling pathway activation protein [Paenibacillus thiaminolyticus]MCY9609633.1 KinB-signaling pathway activation protein [Paenibacillus thiaminolyticus]MCY9615465.1 KinB-signaling pathway activation protein [Paenibacillus thiaminolyticus]MCY9620534.1 KinB-signaling pathway activation protein [Paenibacillus thiamino